jgi:hypothetical protein
MKWNWKLWFKAAIVRAVKTIAQYIAATITVGMVLSDLNWTMIGSAAIVAGIYSLLTSLAGLPEVDMEQRLVDNENCYVKIAQEANGLREELYPEDDGRESEDA